MKQEQLEALMKYVRAVASREAVQAAHGHTEGGYDAAERACEERLRRLFMTDDRQGHNAGDERAGRSPV